MRTVPEERFESVHALDELLPFGSAHAREKWRPYYLADRLKAAPKASTHAMPLIEAMARGLSPATPSSDPAGFASTAVAEPVITPRQTRRCPYRRQQRQRDRPDRVARSAVPTAAESIAQTTRTTRWPLWRRSSEAPSDGRRRMGRVATTGRAEPPKSSFRGARRAARGPRRRRFRHPPRATAARKRSRRRRSRPRPQRRPDRRRQRTRARRTDGRTGRRRRNGQPTAFRSCRELDTLRRRSLSSRACCGEDWWRSGRGRDRLRIRAGARGRG